MISSKFPNSFRGFRDLVVFSDFFLTFEVFFRLSKIHLAPPYSSETCMKSLGNILIEFQEKSKVPFFARSKPYLWWHFVKHFQTFLQFIEILLKCWSEKNAPISSIPHLTTFLNTEKYTALLFDWVTLFFLSVLIFYSTKEVYSQQRESGALIGWAPRRTRWCGMTQHFRVQWHKNGSLHKKESFFSFSREKMRNFKFQRDDPRNHRVISVRFGASDKKRGDKRRTCRRWANWYR